MRKKYFQKVVCNKIRPIIWWQKGKRYRYRIQQAYILFKHQYAYANVKWVADYIADQACNAIVENKVKEIGARNIVTLDKIARYLKSSSTFSDKHDDQYPLNFKEGPDANDVLNYARSLKP